KSLVLSGLCHGTLTRLRTGYACRSCLTEADHQGCDNVLRPARPFKNGYGLLRPLLSCEACNCCSGEKLSVFVFLVTEVRENVLGCGQDFPDTSVNASSANSSLLSADGRTSQTHTTFLT